MEDKEIREAIHKQLETIQINPHLKARTLDYVTKKSRTSGIRYRKVKGLSLTAMTFATMMLVVLVQSKEEVSQPQYLNEATPMAISSEEQDGVMRNLIPETMFSQFKTQLTQASIEFTDDTSFVTDGITIHSFIVYNQPSYFLELSTDVDNESVSTNLEAILSEMNQSLSSYQLFKLDDLNYFLYSGQDSVVRDLLHLDKVDAIQ